MKQMIRIFGYAKPWAGYLAVATIALFAISGVNLLSPYITKLIIAIMEPGDFAGRMNEIISLSFLLLVSLAFRAICQFFSNYFSHIASWRLVNRIRCIMYEHLQKLSMSYYHNKQTG